LIELVISASTARAGESAGLPSNSWD